MPQLADKIRQKYPGVYDDMDDSALETAILAKHPEYADLAKPQEKSADTILQEAKQPIASQEPTQKEQYTPRNILAETHKSIVEQPQHEPDTWWGGFLGSIKNQILGTTIPALQGAAHPDSLGDVMSLVLPSELPNLRQYLPKGKLSNIAESVANPALENIQRNAPYGEGSIMPSTELRGEIQENYPSVHVQRDIMPSPSPDLTPVGEEQSFNSMFGMSGKKSLEQLRYELAQEKFGMGKELPNELSPNENIPQVPENAPKATFLGLQENGEPLFNIESGARDKSTVTSNTLNQMGIEVPPIPSDAVPMRGSELRELAMRNKQFSQQVLGNDEPMLGSGGSKGPQFNPRGRKGMTGSQETIPEDVNSETGEILGGNEPSNEPRGMQSPDKKPSLISEILNTPRALQIGNLHLSAPLRQGLPLITTKAWWTSWDDMFKSFGSAKGYENVINSIKEHPNFQEVAGKPSFAEQSGLRLTNDLTQREEMLGSKWLEKIPGYKPSNRAFTGYLNKLRADTFNSLIEDAVSSGLNPKNDMVLSKQIASFVNNATGRGSLGGLEKHADLLNNALFAPRKIAGNIQMMNPSNYIMTNPFVRKQYLKAFLSTAGAWTTFAGVAKLAGADVSLDPNNADFGKIRIGNTRLDPAGGFQQYLVAGSRLLSNKFTSSTTGKEQKMGTKFGGMTRADVVGNLAENKLNPPFKFAWELLKAAKSRPFNITDQTARLFIPIVAQDVIELAKEDPRLLPTAIPSAFGMGEQTYGPKGTKQTVIPSAFSMQIPH